MNESLTVAGDVRRQCGARKAGSEFASGATGVNHLSLGDRGMNIHTSKKNGRLICGESLDVDFIRSRAVECIGDVRRKLLKVDVVNAVADLFVAGEQEPDFSMRDARIFYERCRQ